MGHGNTYDQYAAEYAEQINKMWKETSPSFYFDLVLPTVLKFAGDVRNLHVLDAGCGEGTVARLLADQGARVTAVDVSPRLVELAKAASGARAIEYHVRNLAQGMPEYVNAFDLAISNLVLNDVADYQGYIATLGELVRPGGRVIASLNNPYSAVIREKVRSYFDSGQAVLYRGFAEAGLRLTYYHRTLEEYLTEFARAGFLLQGMSDLPLTPELLESGNKSMQKYHEFPYFMVLELLNCGMAAASGER